MFISVASYIIFQTIETISFGSRVAGKVVSRRALGTTLQQTIFTGSRLFLVLLLPTLAYLVEQKISIEAYTTVVIISLFSTSLIGFLVLLELNYFQKFFQKVFSFYEAQYMPSAILRAIFGKKNVDPNSLLSIPNFSLKYIALKKTIVSFVAYTFLTTGFFITFMLALIFFDYRLTISQFAVVFHGFGAILVGFYLDPMLSRSIDETAENEAWLINVYSILFGRVLSYFVSSVVFTIIFIIGFLNAT